MVNIILTALGLLLLQHPKLCKWVKTIEMIMIEIMQNWNYAVPIFNCELISRVWLRDSNQFPLINNRVRLTRYDDYL